MKSKFTIIVMLLAFVFTSQAQKRYRIVYDYKSDKTSYFELFRDSIVVLQKPKIKRNSMVEIQLKNVNPFAVKTTSYISQNDTFREGNHYNIGSLFSNISGLSKDPSGLGLNINTPELNDSNITQSQSTDKDRGTVTLFTTYKTSANKANTLTSNILVAKNILISKLTNPSSDKASIKTALLGYLDGVLKDNVSTSLKSKTSFIPFIQDVRKQVSNNYMNVKNASNNLKYDFKAQIINGDLDSNTNVVELNNVILEIEESIEKSLKNLDQIQNLYNALEISSFEQTIDREIKKDKMSIKFDFERSDFSQQIGGKSTSETLIREREIKVYATGGLKINTSIALTLNNFGNNSNDFFVDTETNMVGADKNDYFVPSLATMINFYPYTSKNVNVGGSFGLSIPITGDTSGISFLLGPTLFLGSENRLSFSGGVAYGSVKRLKNNLQVGDVYTGDTNKLTKNIYDFGYYFGISFSLFDVKK